MNTENGWIKLYRNLLTNRSFWINKDKLAIWLFLLLKATHSETTGYFEGKEIPLKAGQILVSYQEIADFLEIDKGKVKRTIQSLRNDTRIDTRTDRQKSLITLVDWDILQGASDTRNDTVIDTRMTHDRHTVKETENEKEKRSKREKDKEKEINKNERMEEVCVNAHTKENILVLGRYKNVFVDSDFYEEFKEKYWYYDKVIDKLSAYKQSRGIANKDDRPYLEQFAIEDKDKYIKPCVSSYDTFDADEFFEAALRRSYADMDDDDEW